MDVILLFPFREDAFVHGDMTRREGPDTYSLDDGRSPDKDHARGDQPQEADDRQPERE